MKRVFYVVAGMAIFLGAARAQQIVSISSPNGGEFFGFSVAALPNGNVVVGAIGTPLTSGAGRVYVYDPDTCGADTHCDAPLLQIDSPLSGDQDFGLDTATTSSGDIAVASQDRVLIFDGSATGSTSSPAKVIDLGQIEGGGVVSAVAATASDEVVAGVLTGRAFVFDATSDDADPRLTIVLPGSNVSVTSLAVGGNVVAVGTAEEGGRVFLFDGSGVGTNDTPFLTINNPGSSNNAFAEKVALTEDGNVAVGARLDGSGAVYIFDGDATGETDAPTLTLRNPDNFPDDGFGNAVATLGSGHIVVGAHVDLFASGLVDSGSVYVFDPTTCDSVVSDESDWPDSAPGDGVCEVPEIAIENPDPGQRDHFGRSVAGLADGTIIIGASQDDTDGVGTGQVFLFEGPAQDSGDGGSSECLNTFRIGVTDPDNLIIVGTSLTEYMRCTDLIPEPLEVDRLCFPECFDDPACHDDGCPFPFMSVVIDPLIQESTEFVLKGDVSEARFMDALRRSLSENATRISYRPPVEARRRPTGVIYVFALGIALLSLFLFAGRSGTRA